VKRKLIPTGKKGGGARGGGILRGRGNIFSTIERPGQRDYLNFDIRTRRGKISEGYQEKEENCRKRRIADHERKSFLRTEREVKDLYFYCKQLFSRGKPGTITKEERETKKTSERERKSTPPKNVHDHLKGIEEFVDRPPLHAIIGYVR